MNEKLFVDIESKAFHIKDFDNNQVRNLVKRFQGFETDFLSLSDLNNTLPINANIEFKTTGRTSNE